MPPSLVGLINLKFGPDLNERLTHLGDVSPDCPTQQGLSQLSGNDAFGHVAFLLASEEKKANPSIFNLSRSE